MAKLYFRYGAMGASKTLDALTVRYNFEERGKKALLAKSEKDTRDGKFFASRTGLKYPCIWISELKDQNLKEYDCIIIDEVELLTKEEVLYLVKIVDEFNIPVISYGLRTDSNGNLFEGSKYMLIYADSIEEIKTICWCGKKAIMNARFDANGDMVKDGEQIAIGGNEKYIGLCRKHWMEGKLRPDDTRGDIND